MSYEKAPTRRRAREKGNKTIFVERKPTNEERDCQIPRFLQAGYVENKELSSDRVMAMDIPYDVYNERTKQREETTTRNLLNAPSAGLPGEFMNKTELLSKRSMESFMEEDDEDDSGE